MNYLDLETDRSLRFRVSEYNDLNPASIFLAVFGSLVFSSLDSLETSSVAEQYDPLSFGQIQLNIHRIPMNGSIPREMGERLTKEGIPEELTRRITSGFEEAVYTGRHPEDAEVDRFRKDAGDVLSRFGADHGPRPSL